jgi:hypothetical protein
LHCHIVAVLVQEIQIQIRLSVIQKMATKTISNRVLLLKGTDT